MTVKLVFKGDIPMSMIVEVLQPPGGGVGFDVSGDSPGIDRHNIRVETQGQVTHVYIDAPGLSEMSANTLQSIKDTIPTDHIKTVDV